MPSLTIISLIIAGLAGLAFAYCDWREPRRLMLGWLFNLFLFTGLFALALLILQSNQRLLIAVTATLFLLFLLLVAAVFALHLVWLAWNAVVVWRREGHSLGNMLTLLLFLGIAALEVGASFGSQYLPTWLYDGLAVFFTLTIAYVLVTLYNFLTALVVYNLRWHRYNQDYLIVLGAGLIDGQRVSPLLAARINAGIAFYQKQKRKTGKHAVMIFSGGQGGDEKLAEGVAMQRYAVAHGVPAADTLIEDRSTTTFENMRFSRALIMAYVGDRPYHATFFTNNYHLFRAGIYARLAGLNANGKGAATSFYFLPNAVIREYLALVLMNKRRHTIVAAGIVALTVLTAITQLLNH